MVWYYHLLKSFPQFVVIHTVRDFGIVNKAEVDVFLELACFFDDLADVGNLISGIGINGVYSRITQKCHRHFGRMSSVYDKFKY